jgi:CBS-domain-containing membrane protein
MSELIARDIMTRNVIRVHDDWDLSELSATFTQHMITGAPVIDRERRLVGVVSTTDLARHKNGRAVRDATPHEFYVEGGESLSEGAHGYFVEEGGELKVRDIMTPTIFSVPLNASLSEMAVTLVNGRVHRLLVTEGKEVVGIVTTLDMLETLRQPVASARDDVERKGRTLQDSDSR